jgi:hypothetical protein
MGGWADGWMGGRLEEYKIRLTQPSLAGAELGNRRDCSEECFRHCLNSTQMGFLSTKPFVKTIDFPIEEVVCEYNKMMKRGKDLDPCAKNKKNLYKWVSVCSSI